jgi:hypothetical protein
MPLCYFILMFFNLKSFGLHNFLYFSACSFMYFLSVFLWLINENLGSICSYGTCIGFIYRYMSMFDISHISTKSFKTYIYFLVLAQSSVVRRAVNLFLINSILWRKAWAKGENQSGNFLKLIIEKSEW